MINTKRFQSLENKTKMDLAYHTIQTLQHMSLKLQINLIFPKPLTKILILISLRHLTKQSAYKSQSRIENPIPIRLKIFTLIKTVKMNHHQFGNTSDSVSLSKLINHESHNQFLQVKSRTPRNLITISHRQKTKQKD